MVERVPPQIDGLPATESGDGLLVRGVRFFAAGLISGDYRTQMAKDLLDAEWGLVAVCYFDENGRKGLGEEIANLLQKDERSKFLVMATCASIEPLLNLKADAPGIREGQLRCVLDLGMQGVKGCPDEPDFRLLHSKTALLFLPGRKGEPQQVILYAGSHNWTGPGLGNGHVKNVESSLRIQFECSDLGFLSDKSKRPQTGRNAIADAFFQFHAAFRLSSATDLTWPKAKEELLEWRFQSCHGQGENPELNSVVVAPAVYDFRSAAPDLPLDPAAGETPAVPQVGDRIYVQHFKPESGSEVEKGGHDFFSNATTPLALFVWASAGRIGLDAPQLLICGSGVAAADTKAGTGEEFQWALTDPAQNCLRVADSNAAEPTSTVVAHRNLKVYHWTLQPVGLGATSKMVNRENPDSFAVVRVLACIQTSMVAGQLATPQAALALHLSWSKQRRLDRRFPVFDRCGELAEGRAAEILAEQADQFGTKKPSVRPDTKAVLGLDVYECAAPINSLLLGADKPAPGLDGVVRARPPKHSKITGESETPREYFFRVTPRGEVIPRLQKLQAPGRSILEDTLDLASSIDGLDKLFPKL